MKNVQGGPRLHSSLQFFKTDFIQTRTNSLSLAKDGSQQQQESPSTSYNEANMFLKQAHRKTWQRKRGDRRAGKPYFT
jgi:hypothetical protein